MCHTSEQRPIGRRRTARGTIEGRTAAGSAFDLDRCPRNNAHAQAAVPQHERHTRAPSGSLKRATAEASSERGSGSKASEARAVPGGRDRRFRRGWRARCRAWEEEEAEEADPEGRDRRCRRSWRDRCTAGEEGAGAAVRAGKAGRCRRSSQVRCTVRGAVVAARAGMCPRHRRSSPVRCRRARARERLARTDRHPLPRTAGRKGPVPRCGRCSRPRCRCCNRRAQRPRWRRAGRRWRTGR